MEAWREELYHGRDWKRHKYIRKEGNRYIYAEDLKKAASEGITNFKRGVQRITSNITKNRYDKQADQLREQRKAENRNLRRTVQLMQKEDAKTSVERGLYFDKNDPNAYTSENAQRIKNGLFKDYTYGSWENYANKQANKIKSLTGSIRYAEMMSKGEPLIQKGLDIVNNLINNTKSEIDRKQTEKRRTRIVSLKSDINKLNKQIEDAYNAFKEAEDTYKYYLPYRNAQYNSPKEYRKMIEAENRMKVIRKEFRELNTALKEKELELAKLE